MKNFVKPFIYSLLLAFSVSFILNSCGETVEEEKLIEEEVLNPKSSLNTSFDGKIFSIPSPVQTSMLIKDAKLPFTESLLNPVENVDLYTDESKRALNLGIYGTDLGYTTLYNQSSKSLKYLKVVEKLTNDLGLQGAFDKNFMERFDKNNTNQDSMMRIVADAFRKADSYLKNNDRKNTSVLILTGGWIESLYYSCELSKSNKNQQIVERIGEQQATLINIIEILALYNKNGVNDGILTSLEDLKKSFDLVTIEYMYVSPKTDEANKTTTLQHSTTVKLETFALNLITKKINQIRTTITQ